MDLEVRHINAEESILYFIRKKYNIFLTLSIVFAMYLDPHMVISVKFHLQLNCFPDSFIIMVDFNIPYTVHVVAIYNP